MNNKRFLAVFILFLMVFSIFPEEFQEYSEISLQLKVLNLTEAESPELFNDYIIFTYQMDKPVRYIGIRFEHEDYKELHIYSKNGNDIYFLVFLIPEEFATLKYRMVVDGLWITDQYNNLTVSDQLSGIEFSLIELGEGRDKIIENPIIENNSNTGFAYKSEPGDNIYIIGDFNNWDPYMYKLEEVTPGYYYISLSIGPGRHYYNFVINGEVRSDPNNLNNVYDRECNLMAFFNLNY